MGVPSFICRLVKGKFIGGQKGFVDTFNWVAKSLYNLKARAPLTLEWNDGDHPEIGLDEEEMPSGEITIDGYSGNTATSEEGVLVFGTGNDSNVRCTCEGNQVRFDVYYI